MQESRKSIRLLPVWILLGATIIVGIVWSFSASHHETFENTGEIPLIAPLDGPTKVKPDNPGGIEVLYPDVEILKHSTLNPKKANVNLLPAPEIPMKLPEWDGDNGSQNDKNFSLSKQSQNSKIIEKVEVDRNDQNSNESFVKKAENQDQNFAELNVKLDEDKNRPVLTSASSGTKNRLDDGKKIYAVQVGATQNKKLANDEARRIMQAHKNILGSAKVRVVRVDLGTKGVWYRLRISNLSSSSFSEDLCRRLKLLEIGCFVVR